MTSQCCSSYLWIKTSQIGNVLCSDSIHYMMWTFQKKKWRARIALNFMCRAKGKTQGSSTANTTEHVAILSFSGVQVRRKPWWLFFPCQFRRRVLITIQINGSAMISNNFPHMFRTIHTIIRGKIYILINVLSWIYYYIYIILDQASK